MRFLQANKPYPQQHKLPVKSLQTLGLEVPKPIEAIARSMASDLAPHAAPTEAGVMPGSQGEAPSAPASMPSASAEIREPNPEGAHQVEYANPGGPSRLHELLTPSQAQALGKDVSSKCYPVVMQTQPLPRSLKIVRGF